MRYLSVGGIFKNEGHVLQEWVEHYLHHGAEHIYLIDDGSTDGGSDTIRDYIERGLVTLYRETDHPYYNGRQIFLYNRYFLPHVRQTHWLLIVDLDEFMWSPRSVDMRPVLAELNHIGLIQTQHTIFGSNGHIETPKGVVASYTRRASQSPTGQPDQKKYFANSTLINVSSIRPHHADFTPRAGQDVPWYVMDETWFVLNHYACQSLHFWRDVKCTRGSANHFKVDTMETFAAWDLNDVEDTRLLEQNRPILCS
jgi:hypothetical protein